MSKAKMPGSNHSLVTLLSLFFLIFGIGAISYAGFNILSQSGYFMKATPSGYKIPADKSEINKLKENSTAKVKSETSKVMPEPIKINYPVYPVEGDNIGSLTIPAINRKLPIIQGTDEEELKKGVGHFTQSVLPGEEDNCVFSGHRDTVFRELGKLKIGDKLIVETSAGIFTYEVNGTRIVHKDDRTVIVPKDSAVLTLTTCYPFNFIGSAPDRYIVSANLVKNK
jgi:sortase A